MIWALLDIVVTLSQDGRAAQRPRNDADATPLPILYPPRKP